CGRATPATTPPTPPCPDRATASGWIPPAGASNVVPEPPATTEVASLVHETERWFLRRGIPHFIEDYRAGEDVFTRALPILALVFIVEVAGAASLGWTWWQNASAVAAGAVLVAGIWAGVNRLRGRRAFHPPDD